MVLHVITQHSAMALLAGLSLGSILRELGSRGFSQPTIRRIYRVWAPFYKYVNVYLLGQPPRLRRLAVARLPLRPGDSVLDLSCGTGANFPFLQEAIGPLGRLVGVDYTPAMLAEAERLVRARGRQNVELLQADAVTLELGRQFDAVLWTLAASVVPDWQRALERAVAHLKPAGRLVLADARFSRRYYAVPFHWVADIMGIAAAADIRRQPWELLPRYLQDVGYEDLLLGFLYVAWGQEPADRVRH